MTKGRVPPTMMCMGASMFFNVAPETSILVFLVVLLSIDASSASAVVISSSK